MTEADLRLKRAIRGLAAPAETPSSIDAGALANRLDERGCSYGRVSNARLEEIARGYERVEAKLNAVLLTVTGTFVSTVVGMVVYCLRGS